MLLPLVYFLGGFDLFGVWGERGKKISFIRQVNDLFMKYNIPLALLAATRTFAEGVNAAFTEMQVFNLLAFLQRLPGGLFS